MSDCASDADELEGNWEELQEVAAEMENESQAHYIASLEYFRRNARKDLLIYIMRGYIGRGVEYHRDCSSSPRDGKDNKKVTNAKFLHQLWSGYLSRLWKRCRGFLS